MLVKRFINLVDICSLSYLLIHFTLKFYTCIGIDEITGKLSEFAVQFYHEEEICTFFQTSHIINLKSVRTLYIIDQLLLFSKNVKIGEIGHSKISLQKT